MLSKYSTNFMQLEMKVIVYHAFEDKEFSDKLTKLIKEKNSPY